MATHSRVLAWRTHGQRSLAMAVHSITQSWTGLQQLTMQGIYIIILIIFFLHLFSELPTYQLQYIRECVTS